MITCYDATFARILAKTAIDCVLVGDSCAMVVYGEKTTIPATVAMIAHHVHAVRKGLPQVFLIADMPFLSHRKGIPSAVEAAGELMQAGADAIKLEGLDGHEEVIAHLVRSGIPVMGHLGLTPQSYHTLGGYKVQGRGTSAAEQLKIQAQELERLGCFSIVLECIPETLGGEIARSLAIPVIGIGAGREVDGQVLVLHDLLGLTEFKTTFVRRYMEGASLVEQALNDYCRDITTGSFPAASEVFNI
jgi:3-methyl-2-oxobutanoate hydroxymethyltransferase